MDRRSVVSLAAAIASGAVLSGCMEAPRNDGQMFQRWASAVSEIPTTDEEALARDAGRARATLAQVGEGAASPADAPSNFTFRAEQAGLRPAMTVTLVDPLDLPNARDLGLRGMIDAADAPDLLKPRIQQASLDRPSAAPRPSGGYAARLAAFRTRADAEATWRKLQAANAGLLSGVAPRFETVDLGARGKWVRLMTGPLPTQAAAARVCRAAGVTDPWCSRGRPS